ncbi:MAG TPA: hypothetical protein QKA14_00700 [Candidatus Megaira endosymbiont of Hartmannula sinica]|nr:hypothetical protein [Candidatus Megaera endosymbiont of Hartmannula sinica]
MRLGIVEMGSNALKLIVYDSDKIGDREVFSIKFKSDVTHILNNKTFNIKSNFYAVIEYIKNIFIKLNVVKSRFVATELFRIHKKSSDFVQHIKQKYNIEIEIITGEEEARLSALGVVSVNNHTHGIIVDLGGASLEIINVRNNNINYTSSTNIEILDKKDLFEDFLQVVYDDINKITSEYFINKKNSSEPKKEIYSKFYSKNIYFSGGSLKILTRHYIRNKGYLLTNLHNNIINVDDFLLFLNSIERKVALTSKVGNKRINSNSIKLVKSLINKFRAKNIIVSAAGLKEGIRYELLEEEEKNKDFLEETIKKMVNFDSDNIKCWSKCYSTITKILRKETSIKSDKSIKNVKYKKYNQFYNFEYISKLSFILCSKIFNFFDHSFNYNSIINQQILNSNLPFSPKQRIMVAIIASYFSRGSMDNNLFNLAKNYITINECNNCKIMGYYFKICHIIDGFILNQPPSFDINFNKDMLEIESFRALPKFIFHNICSYIKHIALARKSDKY